MTEPSPLLLPPHRLTVALFQPQIAGNTGNVGRLCVAAGAELHLVRPMGFVLSDRQLRRSGMDYWERLKLIVHDDDAAFFAAMGRADLVLLVVASQAGLTASRDLTACHAG